MISSPRLVAALPFSLAARASAAMRAAGLCARLGERFEVVAVTCADETGIGLERLPRNVRVERLAPTAGYVQHRQSIEHRYGAAADLLADELALWLNPRFRDVLAGAAHGADAVLTVPALAPTAAAATGLPVVLLADRIDYFARRNAFGDCGNEALHRIAAMERRAWDVARTILVSCGRDAELLMEIFDVPAERIVVVPPGPEALGRDVLPAIGARRAEVKASSTLAGKPVVAIVLSADGANVPLLSHTLQLAAMIPAASVLVVGTAGLRFAGQPLPPNVGFTGYVDDTTYDLILSAADVAIDPNFSGTGADLRVLDYLRHGVPTVVTPAVARGLAVEGGMEVVSPHAFPARITELLADPQRRSALSTQAADAVARWRVHAPDPGVLLRDLFPSAIAS